MEGKTHRKPRILVVPLDWGLGHATRCIPIIRSLLQAGADVWLAGEGAQQALLTQEFPGLPFLPLQGYRVQYSRTRWGLAWKLLIQMKGILSAIRKENKWLENIIEQHQIDAVISDNRFGLYTRSIPCVFITHQLSIKTAFGKWANAWIQKKNYSFINRYTACWVPDIEKEHTLTGELSHPLIKPSIPVHYIGLLSRLEKLQTEEKPNHLFISLSGPEPQRTLLEEKIIKEIAHYTGTATIVRGLPHEERIIPSTNDIKFYNHLPTQDYNKEMQRAEYIISRSGYSTVMDIIWLQKKSILIPTPGQPEQEYLAKYLMDNNIAYASTQHSFSLNNALVAVKNRKYMSFEAIQNSLLLKLIDELISNISKQEKEV